MSTLTAVTWNIFGGQKLDEVIALLKECHAEVIALQEVLQETDGTHNQAQNIAEALGMHFVYAPAHVLTPGGSYVLEHFGIERSMDWGNAILSIQPIVSHRVHKLSESRSRIALEATLENAPQELHIFSTHLVGGHTESHNATRLEQIHRLVPLVPPHGSIVMGDFNAGPESEVITKMKEVVSSTQSDPSLAPTRKGEQIDYIFTTSDFTVEASEMLRSDASDHFPLRAKLEY